MASSVVVRVARQLLPNNRRSERGRSISQGSKEEVDALHQLQNLWICTREKRSLLKPIGLPVVKAFIGSGLENQQGRLDFDFRPGAEEFRASSS
jgi:hypothetical protein